MIFNRDYEKKLFFDKSLPSSTMVPDDASTVGRWRIEQSFFLSLMLEANICVAFDADRADHLVHEKINGQKLAVSTSIMLCSYFRF